jgi:hypothetical protein
MEKKSAVCTYLVADNPDAGEVEPLEPPVHAPETPAEDFSAERSESITDGLGSAEGVDERRHPPEDSADDEVARHVHQTTVGLTDEEARWDSSADLTQGPTADKSLLSIEVGC